MWRRKKPLLPYSITLLYGEGKKKLIGCLVGLGNLPGPRLLCGVTVCVGDNSIYIRPSLPRRGVWAPTTTIAMVRR